MKINLLAWDVFQHPPNQSSKLTFSIVVLELSWKTFEPFQNQNWFLNRLKIIFVPFQNQHDFLTISKWFLHRFEMIFEPFKNYFWTVSKWFWNRFKMILEPFQNQNDFLIYRGIIQILLKCLGNQYLFWLIQSSNCSFCTQQPLLHYLDIASLGSYFWADRPWMGICRDTWAFQFSLW